MATIQTAKRLTAKTFGVVPNLTKLNAQLAAEGKATLDTIDLYIIEGTVSESFIKTTQYGDSIGFGGSFLGVNVQNGEMAESSQAYLPRPADTLLANALRDSKGEPVYVKMLVSIKPHNGDKGYEYVVKSLVEGREEVVEAKKALLLEKFGIKIAATLPPLAAPSASTAGAATVSDTSDVAKAHAVKEFAASKEKEAAHSKKK